jgi:hypothetical protein
MYKALVRLNLNYIFYLSTIRVFKFSFKLQFILIKTLIVLLDYSTMHTLTITSTDPSYDLSSEDGPHAGGYFLCTNNQNSNLNQITIFFKKILKKTNFFETHSLLGSKTYLHSFLKNIQPFSFPTSTAIEY